MPLALNSPRRRVNCGSWGRAIPARLLLLLLLLSVSVPPASHKPICTVVVVPLSSSPAAGPPLLVPLVCAGRPAVALLDQIRAVAKDRLAERMDRLSDADLAAVEDGLRQVLELG
jgi:mRNA-degrading endonuclease toxin of MazEF toxin-antitoxin module